MTRTRVRTVECPFCHYEIYSRTLHDFHSCADHCRKTTVDGGFDYLKVSFDPKGQHPKTRFRYVKASRYILYQDWNNSLDIYGVIPAKRISVTR